jgi:hypothetical protein
MVQVSVKSQSTKVASVVISVVVRPSPPSEVVKPLESVSQ